MLQGPCTHANNVQVVGNFKLYSVSPGPANPYNKVKVNMTNTLKLSILLLKISSLNILTSPRQSSCVDGMFVSSKR
jgi:hypothetical protein